jgi:uncharacterized membrane protein YbhN (UPF0104 family)
VRHGSASWLIFAAVAESLSLVGYITAFRVLVAAGNPRLGWRFSAEVTLAGVVATKLIAALGAGGVALNVWALRAAGLSMREIGERMSALLVTLYGVFMAALCVFALGLYAGVLPGPAPTALTLLPALIAIGVAATAGALLGAPLRVAGGLRRVSNVRGPLGAGARLGAGAVDAGGAGIRRALRTVIHHPLGVIGAAMYWGLDLAALWGCLHAFGTPPAFAGVVVSYFVAQLLGALPVPGGVGVVDGGLAGALIAFGASGSLAVVGVIAYRFISYWLPTAPGALAYASLLRTVEGWRVEDAASAAEAPTAEAAT